MNKYLSTQLVILSLVMFTIGSFTMAAISEQNQSCTESQLDLASLLTFGVAVLVLVPLWLASRMGKTIKGQPWKEDRRNRRGNHRYA